MPESMKIVCYNCAQKLDVTEFSPFSKLPCPICASELIIPKIFGNFLLEEDFGLGYTGQLYRSMDRTLDREVAIRVLPINTDDSEKEEERFNRHAKAISSLTNPSIVPIYSCGMMEEQPYLAMQFMTGGNLVNRLNRKNDFTQLLIWFKSTIHALNLAESKSVVHGFLRPVNMLLDEEKNLKICEFGMVNLLFPPAPLYADGELVGEGETLPISFLSPERITEGTSSAKGDIYSLAAIFYCLLVGKNIFDGDKVEVIEMKLAGEIPSIISARKDLPNAFATLIDKMLSVDPVERPENFDAIIKSISEIEIELATQETFAERKKAPPIHKNKLKNNKKAVKRNKIQVSRGQYPTRRLQPKNHSLVGFFFLKLIPLFVVTMILLLAVAHVRHFKWYDKHVRPYIIEEASPSTATPATKNKDALE